MIKKSQVARKLAQTQRSVYNARTHSGLLLIRVDYVFVVVALRDPANKRECVNPVMFLVVLHVRKMKTWSVEFALIPKLCWQMNFALVQKARRWTVMEFAKFVESKDVMNVKLVQLAFAVNVLIVLQNWRMESVSASNRTTQWITLAIAPIVLLKVVVNVLGVLRIATNVKMLKLN